MGYRRARNFASLRDELDAPPVFRLLPMGGGQSRCVTSAEFYSLFASEFTGAAAMFLHGDGTSQSGLVSLSATGSPTQVTRTVLPSGPNGTGRSARNLSGSGQDYKSAALAGPVSHFSVGLLVRPHTAGANTALLYHGQGNTNADHSFYVRYTSTGQLQVGITNGTSAVQANSAASAVVNRCWQFLVVTYELIGGAADNVVKLYVDGPQSGSTASNLPIPQAAATKSYTVGSSDGGSTASFSGDVAFAFVTEKTLSAATVQLMADAVNGKLTGSFGETVTHTRASAATVVAEDGMVVTTPTGRLAVTECGVQSELGATNRAIRSEEFENAAYTATNVTVTANTHTAPDGTTTADTLAGTASGGLIETTTAFTSSGSNASISLWVRSTSGTQAGTFILRDTTAGADRITVNFTATTTWQRVSGTTTAATGTNNHTLRIYPGGTGGQGTIVAWGAQHETSAVPTSYIATTTGNVARGASVFTVPTTGWPVTAADVRCRVRLTGGLLQAAGANHCLLDTRNATDGWVLFINSSTGTLNWLSLVAGASQTTSSANLTWTAGQWYRLMVRWVGGILQVFRDDVAVVDTTGKTMPATQGNTCFIGCNLSSASQMCGLIGDIEIRR